jgi:hypothetical protein
VGTELLVNAFVFAFAKEVQIDFTKLVRRRVALRPGAFARTLRSFGSDWAGLWSFFSTHRSVDRRA